MRSFITFVFLAAGLLGFTSSTVWACTCDDFPNHHKEFKSSRAVFVGRVIAVEKTLPIPEALVGEVPEVAYAVRFEIEKSWKGAKAGQVVVWLHTSSLVCATWQFKPNERYLVYAREYKHVLIVDTWCSRTRPFERDDAQSIREYKELDSLRAKNSHL